MHPVQRAWTCYQWVGEQSAHPYTSSPFDDADDDVASWNLCQWVGQRPDGGRMAPWTPDPVLDTSGGFSGFGHADSGGQRWALGAPGTVVRPAADERVDEDARAAA